MRTALVLGLTISALLSAPPLRADTVDACIQAAEEGQSLRDLGKLVAAHGRFTACVQAACPQVVRADCAAWLTGVEARVPSVILSALDAGGRDPGDAWVSIDGAPLEPVSSRPRPLDPGAHHLRFTRPSGEALVQVITLDEGQRARPITVRFPAPPPPPPPPPGPRRTALIASIVLGGVALAGGGVFIGLAATAKNDADHLRATCAPRCDPSDVDGVRARLIGANVALGVGIASAVTAAIVLLARPADPPRISREGLVFRF